MNLKATLGAIALVTSTVAGAQSFPEAMAAARRNDPVYQQRQGDVQLEQLNVKQARLAYLPSASLSYQQQPLGGTSTAWASQLSISQPLFDYDKLMQLKQAGPLDARTEAVARSFEEDLARRVFRSMAEIIIARETLRSLDGQIQNLETQTQRARRMRELGQGTVTEISDYDVRLASARANQLTTNSRLHSAERAFALITGVDPATDTIDVEAIYPKGALQPLAWFRTQASSRNTALETARRNVELSELNVKRSRAEYFPKLNGYAAYSKTQGFPGKDDERVGLTVGVPLNAGTLLSTSKAVVDLRKARDAERYAQDFANNEAERLYASLISSQRELEIRQQVIDNGKLAVEGNLRGYQAGIRSNIDVITAIQNLADAEIALITSRLSLASNYLELEILRGAPP